MWQKRPPTYDDWEKSEGYWWVQFQLDNIWMIDLVAIEAVFVELDGTTYSLLDPSPLVAQGNIIYNLRLDDTTRIKGMWWQRVKPPKDLRMRKSRIFSMLQRIKNKIKKK
jgi:hypothetical protein